LKDIVLNQMKEGDKVTIDYLDTLMSKEKQVKLRQLNNVVTVEEVDKVNGEIMGFYSVEFPGYLFTMSQIKY